MKNLKLKCRIRNNVRNMGEKLKNKYLRTKVLATYIMFLFLMSPCRVYATGADPEASWNQVMEFLIKWVPRIGAVLLFFGGVEFSIAYKNEDANSKTNATRLMVAGAMVIAVPNALRSILMA